MGMDLYSRKSRSIPQKIVIVSLGTIFLAVSYGVLFSTWFAKVRVAGLDIGAPRSAILFTFNVIVCVRVLFTLLYFLERKIPLEETLSIPIAFGLYLIGFPLLAASHDRPIEWLEAAGIILFLFGLFLNSFSELHARGGSKTRETRVTFIPVGCSRGRCTSTTLAIFSG